MLVAETDIYDIRTKAPGPSGSLPLTAEMLLQRPSGNIFGLTQNAGMGWNPSELGRKQFLILSTQGGLRAPDGRFTGFELTGLGQIAFFRAVETSVALDVAAPRPKTE